MTSSLDAVSTLAHVPGGLMIAVLVMASVAGFIAGVLFERSVKHQDEEK